VALAHDVQEERSKRQAVTRHAKRSLTEMLQRVDEVLDESEAVIKERTKKRRPHSKEDDGRGDGRG
jgi:glycerol-3-phosphate cytidylyltransferase-like family protein